jgi:hypothetical protein
MGNTSRLVPSLASLVAWRFAEGGTVFTVTEIQLFLTKRKSYPSL